MNKQELASRVWQIANEFRGSIEASEYKDYILGFIFYKYLSDNEYEFLIAQGYEPEDIANITENSVEEVTYIKDNLGYFIDPKDLYQSWMEMGNEFTVGNVMTALSAFNRNINPTAHYQKVFGGIFDTLETGISKLGDSTSKRTKQVRQLTELIQDIPTTHDEYDVLGYIYEYLLGRFAAGAGKSSGEFYTPGSVATFMARTLAHHLQEKENIEVYDPTSGSGSLLLDIGKSFELHQDSNHNVKYFAQEYIKSTERLTRMNLLMRGVKPANIFTRNGDSLEADFPYFDEADPLGTYIPVFVDAVVSNPPYSQKWDPEGKDQDPRFSEYGLAPKNKADYAFLLHGLYHLKSDGIMAIVLPHGVLFREEELEIRKKLIEKNNIEAIVGLPANIFFGTSIPTSILFLKKERDNSDVLFINASKGFEKIGSKNDLRPSDIKRLIDTTIDRSEIEHYSRLVPRNEIEGNEYNLNIPRYVDSGDSAEPWDIFATMNGGIPKSELNQFSDVFDVLPDLYDELFVEIDDKYVELRNMNVQDALQNSSSVARFKSDYEEALTGYKDYLNETLIENVTSVHSLRTKDELSNDMFNRFENISLVDKYDAYGILDNTWLSITNDTEVIQKDTLEIATRSIDPNMVIKKRNGKDEEIQDGNKGRIMPFALIQDVLLKDKKEEFTALENRQVDIQEEFISLIETLSEEDGEFNVLNDKNDKFIVKETRDALSDTFDSVEIAELKILDDYRELSTKVERVTYMTEHPEVQWSEMALKKDGTPTNKGLKDYERYLKASYEFEEDTLGYKLSKAVKLMDEDKSLKNEIKEKSLALIEKTEETIRELTDKQIEDLLYLKWIAPLEKGIYGLIDSLFKELEANVTALQEKYATTMSDIQDEIQETTNDLVDIISNLRGNNSDMEGINTFRTLLGGNSNE